MTGKTFDPAGVQNDHMRVSSQYRCGNHPPRYPLIAQAIREIMKIRFLAYLVRIAT